MSKSKQAKIKIISPPPFYRHSIPIITNIFQSIQNEINRQIEIIQRNKYIEDNINNYANIKIHQYQSLNLIHLQNGSIINQHIKQDQQPTNIPIDNLTITYIQTIPKIQPILKIKTNKSQKSVVTINQTIITQIAYSSKTIKLPNQIKEEQSKFVIDLRNKKIKEDLPPISTPPLKKNKTTINISAYDYNGSPMKVTASPRDNLITKTIKDKLRQQKIVKKNDYKPDEVAVKGIEKQKYKKKGKLKSNKEDDQFTQFLDGQSLTDSVQITHGIRYSSNALVIEQKKYLTPIPELKSRLGKIKITKSQFASIRSNQNHIRSIAKLKTEQQQSQIKSLHKRTYSQNNLAESHLRRRGIIHIINPELKDGMLIKLDDYQPFVVIQREIQGEDPNRMMIKQQPQLSQEKQEAVLVQQTVRISSSRLSTKLPIVPSKPKSPIKVFSEDQVITSLQRQLQAKLRLQ